MPAGYTPGTAEGLLADNELIGSVSRYYEHYLSQFPLLRVFEKKVRKSRTFMVNMITNLLIMGSLTHRPEPGERLDTTVLEQVASSVLFWQNVIDLDNDQHVGLLHPETMTSLGDRADLENALDLLTGDIARRVEIYMRTLHNQVAAILSTQGPASITLKDGVIVSIDWNFVTINYSADWDTSTTKILVDWARFHRVFKQKNRGLMPNLYALNGVFHERFIAGNDQIEGFAIQNPGMYRPFLDTLGLKSSSRDRPDSKANIVYVDDMIIDPAKQAAGTIAGDDTDLISVWPENIIMFAHVNHKVDKNFLMNTVRTFDNKGKGGAGAHAWHQEDPPGWKVRISGNGSPSFSTPERVMVCKVSPNATLPP